MSKTQKQKIVILPSSYPRNESDTRGIFYYEQALALRAIGLDVTVIAPIMHPLYKAAFSKNLFRGTYKPNSSITPTYINEFYGPFPKLPRANALVWSWVATKMLKRYISERGKPDVVHAHCALNAGKTARHWKTNFDIPYIITEHSSGYARALYDSQRLQQSLLVFQDAERRIAVSNFQARTLKDLFPKSPNTNWEVIPNMVNDLFTKTEISDNPSNDHFKFVSVGSLVPVKRYDLLIDAFTTVFNSDPRKSLTIIGNGPQRRKLTRQISSLGMQKQIRLSGSMKPKEILETHHQANAFVSTSSFESFGVAIAEALACGLPTIATKCGGPEDIVSNEDGIITEKDSKSATQQALETMVNDYDKYDRSEISKRARERFSGDNVCRSIASIYSDLVC